MDLNNVKNEKSSTLPRYRIDYLTKVKSMQYLFKAHVTARPFVHMHFMLK